jgi:predicted phosphoribosyltransferase
VRFSDTYFRDRAEAGRRLGLRLRERAFEGDIVVLALPRGGVPVACEAAEAIDAPVDVLVVRKLGAPFNPELAVGSIASGGVVVYNDWVIDQLGLDKADLKPIAEREQRELERREHAYRGGRKPPDIAGKTVILVDDGVATGATMHAGVVAVRAMGPKRVVVAVPTSARDAVQRLAGVADEVIALSTPEPYLSVGSWYEIFDQLTDADVAAWLARAAHQATEEPVPAH